MVMSLRHPTSAPLRAPQRGGKPAPRGASRMVAKQPVRLSLPRPDFSPLKRLLWPLALVVLGLVVYEGTQRLLPYADRPISRISVQGDLRYISQQAVQERIAPFAAASFETSPRLSWSIRSGSVLLESTSRVFVPRK